MNLYFACIAIYELHTLGERQNLWIELKNIHGHQQGPGPAMGDYNAIKAANDRVIGSTSTEAKLKDFNELLEDI